MSWFSEIAGKAEDLLNRVDQSAATALSKPKTPTHGRKAVNPEFFSSQNYASGQTYSAPLKIPTPSSSGSTERSRSTKNSFQASKQQRSSMTGDDELLQFLNNGEALPTPTRKMKLVEMSPQRKPLPASDSLAEITIVENLNDVTDGSVNIGDSTSNVAESQATGAEQNKNEGFPKTEEKDSPSVSQFTEDVTSDGSGRMEEHYQTESAKIEKPESKVSPKKTQLRMSEKPPGDKMARELREREKDLLAALDAKDAQLAILKVRLQEADQELHSKRSIARDLEAENDKMIKEHAQSAAFQNKTIAVLREQLQQAEMDLNKAKESLVQHQNEHMHKMAKMEEEHRQLVDSYSSLQKKWTDLNERSKELSLQLKQSNGNFEALQQEYNDYKQKAQRILQSKEKLITTLKGGSFEVDSIEKNEAASALLNAEVEGIKQERDLIREELRRANELVDTYRSEIQELEKVSHNDSVASQERCQNLKEQLSVEKTQKEESQLLNSQLKEELQILRDELTRSKSNFQSRIQDREIEIEKLRRQLTAKSLSTVSQDELESRLHALTENLIQKQTLVEALSTEKNSLTLQLERLEQQLREAQNYTLHQHAYVGINNNDSERKAKTVFLENPFDSALTRRVKRVYGTIDSLSIRLGVFFRRYPISRVFVFIYMLLLHFWVMIVLLTYEPEIHNANYETKNR